MNDKVLFQGAGYTIIRTYKAETLVPYFEAEREDGNMNYGWFDVRGRPEHVLDIPEARKNKGLANLLRVIAQPCSKLMSSACECGLFDNGASSTGKRWTAGGFVTGMFLDAQKNVESESLVELARYILGGIEPTVDHHISYEMFIEPLKGFFGRLDCHALTIKPFGHGESETLAWAAFEHASNAVANSIQRGRPEADRITLLDDGNC
ncbi:MAG: hypothetical protein KGJ79_12870 [Alphaproteobacteria bacterium]|nr:hypothetical protein [Alphaproteobacteria bacterium]MDE2112029.1 hypothetical protein [Alphaproteobacteria bacterium]MDE2492261.1 hypothetical protein [Alphaproteobacteria bacterium]